MKHLILAASLSLLFAACAHMPGAGTQKEELSIQNNLAGYSWDLVDATTRSGEKLDELFVREHLPVRMIFDENHFTVMNTCNTQNGTYTAQINTINFGEMKSTRMLCMDNSLNRLDQKVRTLLLGNFSYALSISEKPTLVLRKSSGETLRFMGTPTPETRYGSTAETLFLEVSGTTGVCSHLRNPALPCLQVREIYYDEKGIQTGNSGEFKDLHQPIEGFVHKEGIRNVLRVKRYAIQNPPAHTPNTAYVLDMVIKSERISP